MITVYGGEKCMVYINRDLTGQRFGKRVVIRKKGNSRQGALWVCRCDCGKESVIREISLINGQSTACRSCSHKKDRPYRIIDITGQQFGDLLVLRCVGKSKHGQCMWYCLCNCGNYTTVAGAALRSKRIRRCRECGNKAIGNKLLKDISGNTYGRLTVVQRVGSKGSSWLCQCLCGNTTTVRSSDLQDGHTVSCGCYRNEVLGKHSFKHGLTNTTEYWSYHHNKRRDAEFGAPSNWSITLQAELNYFFQDCVLCGASTDLHTDHVRPLQPSDGSESHGLYAGNAVRLCHSCNSRKHNKPLSQLPPETQRKLLEAAEAFRLHAESEGLVDFA